MVSCGRGEGFASLERKFFSPRWSENLKKPQEASSSGVTCTTPLDHPEQVGIDHWACSARFICADPESQSVFTSFSTDGESKTAVEDAATQSTLGIDPQPVARPILAFAMGDIDQPAAEESSEDTKKRKLSVEKRRYHCTFPGCSRDYSRAEHLYRHQLNRGTLSETPVAALT